MDFKQETIGDILTSEHEMVLHGAECYGDYFINASELVHLLHESIISVDPDRYVFTMFFSQVRKYSYLALFSTVRLHHVQAMMDERKCWRRAHARLMQIANPELKDFAVLQRWFCGSS
jgi:hypothetical protein